jgi:hypothetical protein
LNIMNNRSQSKINNLLQKWPPHTVATNRWLQEQGISRTLVTAYERGGWVERIGSGAAIRCNDRVGWVGAVYALQQQLGLDIHPGGKTALALQSAIHNIPTGKERVVLFAQRGEHIPVWLGKHTWDARVEIVKTNLFSADPEAGMATMPFGDVELKISSRERAMLEVLNSLTGSVGNEPKYLMDGLATLQPQVVQRLLLACSSVKVKRLFLVLAEESEHAWLGKLDTAKVDLGKGNRQFARNGYLHQKYHITVPRSWRHGEENA